MQKLKYTIFDSLVNLCRHRYVDLIVTVSFALGMILPILCLGNINVFAENVSTMRYKNDAIIWIAYFEDGYISPEEMNSLLQEDSLKISEYAISAYKSGTIEINGTRNNGFISYLTEDWTKFENCKIIEGTLELFGETNICLVEQSLSEKYGGLHAGDKITIFGIPYTVNGIFSSFNYYGKILLPFNINEQSKESDIMISQLYLRTEEQMPNDGENIAYFLKRIGLSVSDVKSGEEIYHACLKAGIYQSMGIIFVGFVSFAFAAINICLVLVGKINLDKRTYGIRMALGATYNLVFLSAVIENMLCFGAAYLIDIVMVHILKPTYPKELTIILNDKVYIFAYIFGAFMTIVVTWIALYKLKRKKLVELFERVS